MASEKQTTEDQQARENRLAMEQRSALRTRIKAIAKDIMNGHFDTTTPYKPKKIHQENNAEWQTLWRNQQTLVERIAVAKDAMDGGVSKQALIYTVRAGFPDLAKKIPEPVKKAPPPRATPVAPPVTSPTAAKEATPASAAGTKLKQIDDDEDDDEEYDPDADGRAQREERAAKRQRSTAQDVPAEPKQPTTFMDEDELNMQIEEINMKAQLQILQLKRKFAADKKKRLQSEGRVKTEGA